MHAGHIKRLALWSSVLVVGGLFLWSPGANGQGVPSWAPHVSDTSGSDGGVDGGSVLHAVPIFREPDAGPRRNFLTDTMEFILGFNPLEPSAEELARKAARDGGMPVGLDAGVTADAGLVPVVTPAAAGPADGGGPGRG